MKRPMLVFGLITVFTAAIFLFFKESAALCCAVFGVAAAVGFAVFKRKMKKEVAFAAIFASCAVFASSICFLSFFKIYENPMAAYTRGEFDVKAYVAQLPERREDGSVSYVFKTESVGNEKARFKFTYVAKSDEGFELYDVVSFNGLSFYGVSGGAGDKAYSYSEKIFLRVKNAQSCSVLFKKDKTPYYFCLMFKDGCIKNMKKYLSADSAAMLSGMVFGDKSFMRNEVKNAFRASGVSHIMAVSGLHASLWCGILAALLKLFSVSEKKKAAISIAFLVLLCTLSAFTASVIRASLMTALILTGPLFKRKADSLNSLGFAVAGILLFNPYLLLTPGFLLSVSATAGVIFSNAIEGRFKIRTFKFAVFGKTWAFIRSNVVVSVISTLFTMPVCAAFFKSFCIVSPITNIFVVQPSFYAMAGGLFASVFSFIPSKFAEGVAEILFFVPEILLKFVKFVTFSVSEIPFSQVPADIYTVCFIGASVAAFCGLLKLFEKRNTRPAIKITSYFLCAAVIVASAFSSFFPLPFNRRLCVVSSNGSPCVVLHCGGEYALLGAPESKSAQYEIKEYLPTTSEQRLLYFVLTDSFTSTGAVEFVFENASPEFFVPGTENALNYEKLLKKSAALKADASKFTLNGKIYVETVDTQGDCYAIIKDGNKKAAVLLSGECGASAGVDMLILSESEAKEFSGFCDVLFVCIGKDDGEQIKAELSAHCNRLIVLSDGESRAVIF